MSKPTTPRPPHSNGQGRPDRKGGPKGPRGGKPGGHPRNRDGGADRAPTAPLSARAGALRLLNGVLGEDPRLLSELREAPWLGRLSPPDRARAQRLATETLRQLERCDRLLEKHLKKAPPLPILNILRLGTWELAAGGAAHGVVNDWVTEAARAAGRANMKGLVNAVLRKVAAEAEDEWPKLRAPRLPDWLREPLSLAYGPEKIRDFETAHAAGAPLDLTMKDPASAEHWAKELDATLLPTGSLRLADGGQVSALPGYAEGAWWVQDAAAALPARLLGDLTGKTALDLCAAPGGKTMQLAAAGARVTALDLSETRLARVQENLSRTGLSAGIRAGDALEQTGEYDVILLDAPCSATGTICRHPDLPQARDGDEVGALIELQSAMLDHALTLLAPGGRLVFCTCSLIPDEGECQVEEALERHPGLSVIRPEAPGLDPAWITEEGGVRTTPDLWPDLGGMDGFYMAVLRKSD